MSFPEFGHLKYFDKNYFRVSQGGLKRNRLNISSGLYNIKVYKSHFPLLDSVKGERGPLNRAPYALYNPPEGLQWVLKCPLIR